MLDWATSLCVTPPSVLLTSDSKLPPTFAPPLRTFAFLAGIFPLLMDLSTLRVYSTRSPSVGSRQPLLELQSSATRLNIERSKYCVCVARSFFALAAPNQKDASLPRMQLGRRVPSDVSAGGEEHLDAIVRDSPLDRGLGLDKRYCPEGIIERRRRVLGRFHFLYNTHNDELRLRNPIPKRTLPALLDRCLHRLLVFDRYPPDL